MESDHHRKLWELSDAILCLENKDEVQRFFADLCTPSELKALKERWLVSQLLDGGQMSYREISDKTKISLATIVRVARFLNTEKHHGYKKMLERLNKT